MSMVIDEKNLQVSWDWKSFRENCPSRKGKHSVPLINGVPITQFVTYDCGYKDSLDCEQPQGCKLMAWLRDNVMIWTDIDYNARTGMIIKCGKSVEKE